ncbi:MAG: hypothetical protein CM15mV28_0180 [Thaumasvirus sp.]|nr:MAG: hypothetical protein CM15mV28_0180 [Thaumasvirus sp.]
MSADAVQQNIPTGVVRYRDPYENVILSREGTKCSTNGLTLENGDLLLFEVEDEDRSGIIDADELVIQIRVFEESLYNYLITSLK